MHASLDLGLAHRLRPQQHLIPFGKYVACILLGQVSTAGISLYHCLVLAIQADPYISKDLIPLQDDRLHGHSIYVSIHSVWLVLIPPPAL